MLILFSLMAIFAAALAAPTSHLSRQLYSGYPGGYGGIYPGGYSGYPGGFGGGYPGGYTGGYGNYGYPGKIIEKWNYSLSQYWKNSNNFSNLKHYMNEVIQHSLYVYEKLI